MPFEEVKSLHSTWKELKLYPSFASKSKTSEEQKGGKPYLLMDLRRLPRPHSSVPLVRQLKRKMTLTYIVLVQQQKKV
ncbi:hypothetical protein ACJMK2_008539 [Sinanodonta woodiana]|uniref:Uncharacterized protein n=1 Tax=Sinanodonta woodiana TaxID=1069815 RepID=A0ABD3VPZ7_SINWO